MMQYSSPFTYIIYHSKAITIRMYESSILESNKSLHKNLAKIIMKE